MRVHPKLSATCLGLALTLGSLWWSAASTYVVLHDDARFVSALAETLDQPVVRRQLGQWTGVAFDQAAALAGHPQQIEAAGPVVAQLQQTITSTAPIGPLVAAVTGVAVTTRDAAVAQLDAQAVPKQTVRADVAPLFTLAGLTVDKKTAKAMGLSLSNDKKKVTLPLLTADQLELLQHRYDWLMLIRRWAGWVALALLGVSVATSRLPLRTLAVASGLVAVIAVVLPRLLGWVQARTVDSALGALVTPLLAAASARVAGLAVLVLVVAGISAVAFATLQVVLSRRRRQGRLRDHPGTESES